MVSYIAKLHEAKANFLAIVTNTRISLKILISL